MQGETGTETTNKGFAEVERSNGAVGTRKENER